MVQFKKWQLFLVILFSLFAIIFSSPNFFSKESLKKLPSFFPNDQVVLGLDLQGGSYLLIEVDTSSVVSENLESFSDRLRLSLRKNKISYSKFKVQDENIFFNVRNENNKNDLLKILSKYSQDIVFEYQDTNSLKIYFNTQKTKNIQDNAVSQSIEVVRRRVESNYSDLIDSMY